MLSHTCQMLISKNKEDFPMPEHSHTYRLQTFFAKSLIVLAKYNGCHLGINLPQHSRWQWFTSKTTALSAAHGCCWKSDGLKWHPFPPLLSHALKGEYTHLLLTCKPANEEQALDMYLNTEASEHVCVCVHVWKLLSREIRWMLKQFLTLLSE